MKLSCWITFLFCISLADCFAQGAKKFYVSESGADTNVGSLTQPFATFKKAVSAVRNEKKNGLSENIEVIFRKGIYTLDNPIVFTKDDSGDSIHSISYMSYPGEQVIISGGRRLSNAWVNESGNIWKMKLDNTIPGQKTIRSLYADDSRLENANSGFLYTTGGLPEFANSFKVGKYDYKNSDRLKKDSLNSFCGFSFSGNDLNTVVNDASASIVLYGSWEASWHKIFKIDPTRKTVILKSPARYPVGFFGSRTRYKVVNAKSYLRHQDNWYYDENTGWLYYYGSNPNQKVFYVPVLTELIRLNGDKDQSIINLKFIGLSFRYTNSNWGINSIGGQGVLDAAKSKYPWLDFKTGFTYGQGAFACGQTVILKGSRKCEITNCDFSFLDNYAIRVGEYSSGNKIQQCKITSCGAGGIILGFDETDPIGKNYPASISPSYNVVKNNVIASCGLLHPAGVGISIMQASYNLVDSNQIYDLPYIGISCGWTFDTKDNYTSHNQIRRNVIHDVMKQLADGGGIYTLGKQDGTIFAGNFIYNISRSNDAVGAKNNGFFFDESSSSFKVDSNIVSSVLNQDIRFNKSDSTKISWGPNYFEKAGKNKVIYQMIRKKLKLDN